MIEQGPLARAKQGARPSCPCGRPAASAGRTGHGRRRWRQCCYACMMERRRAIQEAKLVTLYVGGPAGELATLRATLAEAEQEREMADQGREAVELAMRSTLVRSVKLEACLEEALRKAEGEPDRVRTAVEEAVALALKARQDELLGLRHRLSRAEQAEAEAAKALAAMAKDVGELKDALASAHGEVMSLSEDLGRLTRQDREHEAILLSLQRDLARSKGVISGQWKALTVMKQRAARAEVLVVGLRGEVQDGLSLLEGAKAESARHCARAADLDHRLAESELDRSLARSALREADEAHGREVSAMAEAFFAEEAQIWAKARKASILWAALLWLLTMLVAWLSSAWLIIPLASWPWAA